MVLRREVVQRHVLLLGFDEDGEILLGVFPECEEVLDGFAGFR